MAPFLLLGVLLSQTPATRPLPWEKPPSSLRQARTSPTRCIGYG